VLSKENGGRRARGDGLRIVLSHVYSWPEVRRGGERYLHEVASALSAAGHDVTVLSSAPRRGRGLVLDVPVRWFARRPLLKRRLNEFADEFGFGVRAGAHLLARQLDVWHALGTSDAAAAAVLGTARGVRSVHTTLGIPSRRYRDSRPDRRLHDLVVRRIDNYVCLSEAAGEALRSGWGREPLVIGGGVDLRRFAPGPRHPRPALLYSGTLDDPRKNVALLIEAAAVLRRKVPDLELWISGPGSLERLMREAPAAGRDAVVDVGLGEPKEHAERYARAWATVLPSYDEAFGLCLVESLAAGTPIVVLEGSGGPAEIVRPGVGFASPSSAFDLAAACARALELAQTPDIAEACRSEAECYDWRTAIVPRLERVYRGLERAA
jgi:phosphatidyl-myo-inositol alpha-mannosyltransferase